MMVVGKVRSAHRAIAKIVPATVVAPSVPSEVVEKLHNVDIETLTPLEALNFLYELKNTLDKD